MRQSRSYTACEGRRYYPRRSDSLRLRYKWARIFQQSGGPTCQSASCFHRGATPAGCPSPYGPTDRAVGHLERIWPNLEASPTCPNLGPALPLALPLALPPPTTSQAEPPSEAPPGCLTAMPHFSPASQHPRVPHGPHDGCWFWPGPTSSRSCPVPSAFTT